MKKYRAIKSKYYKEEDKYLFRCYHFQYWSNKHGWIELKSNNLKEWLKNIIIDDSTQLEVWQYTEKDKKSYENYIKQLSESDSQAIFETIDQGGC